MRCALIRAATCSEIVANIAMNTAIGKNASPALTGEKPRMPCR
jgi:hypothetical protein